MITINLTLERRHLIAFVGLAMAVVLLVPGVSWASNQFTDVPDTNVFHEDIAWLADAGVTKGCNPPTNDEFCPSDSVTREQMAAFMHRLYTNKIAPLEADNIGLKADNTALQALLAGVTRNGDTLLFTGMNVQIVNGAGTTDTTNSLGNLIVGYNANDGDTRTGSHMLVVGDENSYTSFGGIVAGVNNTTSGAWSSVSGGTNNESIGDWSSVTGGRDNTASGNWSSVTGGRDNTADGPWSAVAGGRSNQANDFYSMIAGGLSGVVADSEYGAILGGLSNTVESDYATISGGRDNVATGSMASIGGGDGVLCSSSSAVFCGEGTLNAAD